MLPENVQEEAAKEIDALPSCVLGETRPATPLRRESLVVFKFGGSSLLGAQRMLHAAQLVRPVAQLLQVVVVSSAMKAATDRLLFLPPPIPPHNPHRPRA